MVRAHATNGPEPASETKDVAELCYRLPNLDTTFVLKQDATLGTTTGTTLWLSAQILTCYVQACYQQSGRNARRDRPLAIELGAGIGLVSLTLARLGWEVIASDVEPVLSQVLLGNVARNASSIEKHGSVTAQLLDWTTFDAMHAIKFERVRLIVTADTVYEPSLVDGLWNTIRLMMRSHHRSDVHVLIALERRDPKQIDAALDRARRTYGMLVERVNARKIRKAVDRYLGSTWSRDCWSEVEIWRVMLNDEN